MRSDRPRRPRIKARRKAKREKRAAAQALARAQEQSKARRFPRGQVFVNPTLLRPTNSYGTPDFVDRGYYVDRPFRCKDCGKPETWTASQQKWWYETAKGDVWTAAIRCRPCRRRERERKAEARRTQAAGLAKRRAGLR